MQFTSAPSCTLFVKVQVKQHPYSQQPISILVNAHNYPSFTSNKALLFTELPLNVQMQDIVNAVAMLQKRNNASNVSVKISPKVNKMLINAKVLA